MQGVEVVGHLAACHGDRAVLSRAASQWRRHHRRLADRGAHLAHQQRDAADRLEARSRSRPAGPVDSYVRTGARMPAAERVAGRPAQDGLQEACPIDPIPDEEAQVVRAVAAGAVLGKAAGALIGGQHPGAHRSGSGGAGSGCCVARSPRGRPPPSRRRCSPRPARSPAGWRATTGRRGATRRASRRRARRTRVPPACVVVAVAVAAAARRRRTSAATIRARGAARAGGSRSAPGHRRRIRPGRRAPGSRGRRRTRRGSGRPPAGCPRRRGP